MRRTTLHMTPRDVWARQAGELTYAPEGFESEGFVHCTDGEDELLAVGNRYYTADPRAFVVLTLDVGRLSARVVYEDPAEIFPHVYGPLETAAVVEVRPLVRDEGGRFVGVGLAER